MTQRCWCLAVDRFFDSDPTQRRIGRELYEAGKLQLADRAGVRGIVDEEDAREMAFDAAYGLAKRAYKL